MYEWDEAKREANLKKHGYDFADADLVYENPGKFTFHTVRRSDFRYGSGRRFSKHGFVYRF